MKTIVSFMLYVTLAIIVTQAQPFNVEALDQNKNPQLFGKINKEALSEENYSEWFATNYEAYEPDPDLIAQLKDPLSEYTITAFFGSWCGDSKRELPKLYNILEAANFPLERLTTIGVSAKRENYKQSPGGEEEGLNIHRVPTFIFYRNGKEINRIVESPVTTMEEDIVNLLKGSYTPKYTIVKKMNEILTEKGGDYINSKQKRIANKLKKDAVNMFELNTYASVLFSSNRQHEAISVLKVNELLFPSEAFVYVNLGNKYEQLNELETAVSYFKKSLQFAENEKVQQKISLLTQ